MKRILKRKSFVFLILGLVALGGIFSYFKSQQKEMPFKIIKVSQSDISQEISETGMVRPVEEITLSFENSGQLKKIYIEKGQKVKRDEILAELDREELQTQLLEVESHRETAQAKLNQLLAGASQEEIKIAQTSLLNAKTALLDAEQNLRDVKRLAEEKLRNVYEDAIISLEDVYLKLYNASNVVDSIQQNYFYKGDVEGQKVRLEKEKIEKEVSQAKIVLEEIRNNPQNEKIDFALKKLRDALEIAKNSLALIRDICEEPTYKIIVSSVDKTSLDTQKANINTALEDISNIQQTISLTRIEQETNINSAIAKLNTTQGEVQKAQDQLNFKKAPPREVDIDLLNSQLKEAEAQVELLKIQLTKTLLKSPLEGTITDILRKAGETIKAVEPIVNLIPSRPFQLKADIYEEEIGKVKISDEVLITLVAFPEKKLLGKVVAIDPAEKLLEGVVYYTATIDFETLSENLKPGMTADIVIKTAFKKNVLTIPKSGLIEHDQKTFVKVFKKDGKIEEREIQIGLQGDDKIEVLSGLQEEEEIVLP